MESKTSTSAEESKHQTSHIEPLSFPKPEEYTADAVSNRWAQQRNAWLSAKNTGADIHDGVTPRKRIPDDRVDLERKKVKKIMKAQAPPYNRCPGYYPLEDAIDLYMQIWYDDSSSSGSSDS